MKTPTNLALVQPDATIPARITAGHTPPLFAASESCERRFWEFFAATIRNKNTRQAYLNAVYRFADWCEWHDIELEDVNPMVVSAYIEQLTDAYAAPTVKQHLAAIRMLFDWLVVGQIVVMNPASSVRGPKHSVKVGKTPVLSAAEARMLLDSIDIDTVVGLRDRALIGVMVYSFGRVSAVAGMTVADYYTQGKRSYLRLHEKGGKHNVVPAHHIAQDYLDAYIASAGISEDRKGPLFRSSGQGRQKSRLLSTSMTPWCALKMVKRRAATSGTTR